MTDLIPLRDILHAIWVQHRLELERMAFEKKLSFTTTKAEVDFELADYLRDSEFTQRLAKTVGE